MEEKILNSINKIVTICKLQNKEININNYKKDKIIEINNNIIIQYNEKLIMLRINDANEDYIDYCNNENIKYKKYLYYLETKRIHHVDIYVYDISIFNKILQFIVNHSLWTYI